MLKILLICVSIALKNFHFCDTAVLNFMWAWKGEGCLIVVDAH